MIRIHQEDTCQALGRMPRQKYQNEGGPSSREIFGLLHDWSSDRSADEEVFVKSLALNWILYGTDSHAKNYSLLIAPGNQVRLAPLYDIASALSVPGGRSSAESQVGHEDRRTVSGLAHWAT